MGSRKKKQPKVRVPAQRPPVGWPVRWIVPVLSFVAGAAMNLSGARSVRAVAVLVAVGSAWIAVAIWTFPRVRRLPPGNRLTVRLTSCLLSAALGLLAFRFLQPPKEFTPEQLAEEVAKLVPSLHDPTAGVPGLPADPGNRVVQVVNGPFQKGDYGLAVEFGANRNLIPPGFAVGVRFDGQQYTESECVFKEPNLDWGFTAGGVACETTFTDQGSMNRFETRPMNSTISPRTSLYLLFRSSKRLRLTDCYFQATSDSEKTPCDSPRIEFRTREF